MKKRSMILVCAVLELLQVGLKTSEVGAKVIVHVLLVHGMHLVHLLRFLAGCFPVKDIFAQQLLCRTILPFWWLRLLLARHAAASVWLGVSKVSAKEEERGDGFSRKLEIQTAPPKKRAKLYRYVCNLLCYFPLL